MSTSNNEDTPFLTLLQKIKSGELTHKQIEPEARMKIIGLLYGEGYSQHHIAQILTCSEKTVYRDLKVFKKGNSLVSSPEFVKETVGEMCRLAYQHWCSLVRIAKSQSATNKEKIDAETAAWCVIRDYIEQLRRIGYLPSATQEVIGKFSHQIDDGKEKSWHDIQTEVNQLVIIAQQTNVLTPDLEKELLALNQKIEKANVQDAIQKIITKENIDKEDIDNAKGELTA